MALAWYDWALIALLAVSIVLVCIGAAMYYAPRPVYNTKVVPARHSQEDRDAGTVRLHPPPHPRNLE